LIPGIADPAPNKLKRLEVSYSYGNQKVLTCGRDEHTLMVLPEDREHIERTVGEYEKKRLFDLEKLRQGMQETIDDKVRYGSQESLDKQRAKGELGTVRQQVEQLNKNIEQERSRKHPLVEQAGTLRSYAGSADWLNKELKEIKDSYVSDGRDLIEPLIGRPLPEISEKEYERRLVAWRALYAGHIGALKKIDPGFSSNLIIEGFPCNDRYNDVRRKIEAHAAFLRERADRLIRADVSGEAL
jgi:hypothetical protein